MAEAKKSLPSDIPVGAVIVRNGAVIGRGHNTREKDRNVLGHAEINAIREAQSVKCDWRLDDCEMYVTLEPCSMCSGAIRNARLAKLYFGAPDINEGGAVSVWRNILTVTEVIPFVMKEENEALLGEFFRNLRNSRQEPQNK